MGYSRKKGANAEKISIKVNPISDSNFVKRPYPQNGRNVRYRPNA